jgi:hypothetical protein
VPVLVAEQEEEEEEEERRRVEAVEELLSAECWG